MLESSPPQLRDARPLTQSMLAGYTVPAVVIRRFSATIRQKFDTVCELDPRILVILQGLDEFFAVLEHAIDVTLSTNNPLLGKLIEGHSTFWVLF